MQEVGCVCAEKWMDISPRYPGVSSAPRGEPEPPGRFPEGEAWEPKEGREAAM